jgi:hypothetical protein
VTHEKGIYPEDVLKARRCRSSAAAQASHTQKQALTRRPKQYYGATTYGAGPPCLGNRRCA